MITKFNYRFFNYKKLSLLFSISFLQYLLFKIPFLNYNINTEFLSQINFKEPIASINGMCPIFINTGLIHFVITTIIEVIRKNCVLLCVTNSKLENNTVIGNVYLKAYYSFDRLDNSNPFLYSNKQASLRE